jgi:FkbH-like protein
MDIKALKKGLRESAKICDLEQFGEKLDSLLSLDQGVQAIQFASNRIRQISAAASLTPMTVTLLSSFTLEPIEPAFRVSEFREGRDLNFACIPYDQWIGALTYKGQLDELNPELIFLFLHLEDVCPLLAGQHLDATKEALEEESRNLIDLIRAGINQFRTRSSAPIILSTFIARKTGIERYFDRRSVDGRNAKVERLNQALTEIAQDSDNVFVFDYAALVTDHGRQNWYDVTQHYKTHSSILFRALPFLASDMSMFISAMVNPRKKVLAVDLDNTLWSGILGEDGYHGILADTDWPGNAYRDFQNFLRNLRASGIILAILSKNNEDDVEEGFDQNRSMPLALSDFSAKRIDWIDKSANLTSIAEELNLSSDAFVFMDDNPLEVELMKEMRPEVTTVHATGTASEFPDLLMASGRMQSVALTEEDSLRAESYTAQIARKDERKQVGDLETFLAGLDLRLEYRSPKAGEMDRVAQLFARTNQFNLTTIRYTISDLLKFLESPSHSVRICRLSDKFGDYGLVGVVILNFVDTISGCEIDSFLMSCRVLGRKVEDGILAEIEKEARERGCQRLVGIYQETKKNRLVSTFYKDHGFISFGIGGRWSKDLTMTEVMPIPKWIKTCTKRDS